MSCKFLQSKDILLTLFPAWNCRAYAIMFTRKPSMEPYWLASSVYWNMFSIEHHHPPGTLYNPQHKAFLLWCQHLLCILACDISCHSYGEFNTKKENQNLWRWLALSEALSSDLQGLYWLWYRSWLWPLVLFEGRKRFCVRATFRQHIAIESLVRHFYSCASHFLMITKLIFRCVLSELTRWRQIQSLWRTENDNSLALHVYCVSDIG
jgi:hypothetical protein